MDRNRVAADGVHHSMTDSLRALRAFFAAEADYLTAGGPGNASFDGMAEHLHPNVVMHQAEALPYGGRWSGPEGIEAFMSAMSAAWSSLAFTEQYLAADGPVAVARSRGVLRSRATGRELDTWVMQWFTFDEGRISEIRPFYLDTAAVLDVLRS
ncbi:nuclear transport factor 2 family protein [Phytomonospora endophytica]|uniref:SnoaL-like domain-containing protein n=1 Tax=Phytomonospora endophytica TaxID=714109 RepID=A0A841FNQ1_9ACTN|nr:nuclear transport factor 2 family protein [Phytomonospora endophytica]MBB6034219.1 hypothetical protein [Phytomonospora endophytica]